VSYKLKPVTTGSEWAAMHALRRDVLFSPLRHAGVVYDENHPDDRHPDHVPFLLTANGRPIGITRLDLRGEIAVVRLVAIAAPEQRRGHGRIMGELVESEARRRDVRLLRVNAAADAVGFYEKTGWRRAEWDPSELTGIAANCVQMEKWLA
jgi:GNAT superfamily N-acetyltransferase